MGGDVTDRDDEIRRRQRTRAVIMAVLLGAFALLVYAITIVKMSAQG